MATTTNTQSDPPPSQDKGIGLGFMVLMIVVMGLTIYFNYTYEVSEEDQDTVVTNSTDTLSPIILGAYDNGEYIEPQKEYFSFEEYDPKSGKTVVYNLKKYTVLRLIPNRENPIYRHGSQRTKILKLQGNEYASSCVRTIDSQGKSFKVTDDATSSFNGVTRFSTSREVLIGIGIINN